MDNLRVLLSIRRMDRVQMVEIHRVQSEGKDAGAIRSAASEYEGIS